MRAYEMGNPLINPIPRDVDSTKVLSEGAAKGAARWFAEFNGFGRSSHPAKKPPLPALLKAIEMISIKRLSDEENQRRFLPGQAKDGESREFYLAACLDGDFCQLLAEIGRSVAVGE